MGWNRTIKAILVEGLRRNIILCEVIIILTEMPFKENVKY